MYSYLTGGGMCDMLLQNINFNGDFMKQKILVLISTLCFMLFVGCATSIPVNIQRPAVLDLGGAESICVVPFKLQEYDDGVKLGGITINFGTIFANTKEQEAEVEIANFLTNELTSKLAVSDYYKLVNSSVVESAIKAGTKVPVDIYLTGKIDKFSEDIVRERKEYFDENDESYYVTKYSKVVYLVVTYQVVDSKDNSVISYKTESYTRTSDLYDDRDDLPKSITVIDQELNYLVGQIYRNIHPYTEVKYLQLKSDKSKNPEFEVAEKLAKNGMIKEAQEKFSSIYEQTQNYEAGYNAALLMQANGDLDNAYNFMKEISEKTADKQSVTALKDIQFEIDSAKKLQAQNSARNSIK